MTELRAWLRPRWWMPLVAALACSAAIYALAPRYTDAQVAGTAAAFRNAVVDAGDARTIGAGLVDMLFVLAYFATALGLARSNLISRIGLGVMAAAASADMVENALVVVGVTRGQDVTDGFVDAISGFGAVKWIGVLLGGVLMLVGLALDRRRPVKTRT